MAIFNGAANEETIIEAARHSPNSDVREAVSRMDEITESIQQYEFMKAESMKRLRSVCGDPNASVYAARRLDGIPEWGKIPVPDPELSEAAYSLLDAYRHAEGDDSTNPAKQAALNALLDFGFTIQNGELIFDPHVIEQCVRNYIIKASLDYGVAVEMIQKLQSEYNRLHAGVLRCHGRKKFTRADLGFRTPHYDSIGFAEKY